MSGDVLSSEQIAALVDAAREGTLPAEPAKPVQRRVRRVRDIDFARPTKFTQEQQRRILRGHQSFARTTQAQLSAELGSAVEVEILNVDQQTWNAAMQEIPVPSLYGVVATAAELPLVLAIEQTAVMWMVERLLGGEGDPQELGRDLTDVELTLARRVFAAIVAQLSRTWQELVETDLTLGGVETQQSTVQVVSQSEPTLAITMELRIDRTSSTMTLLVPHHSIESLVEHLSHTSYERRDSGPDESVERMVHAALRSVRVEVRAEVGSRELTLDELRAIRPGDVLTLGPSAAGGTLYADAVPIHRVRPGRSGRHRAVSVLERIEGDA